MLANFQGAEKGTFSVLLHHLSIIDLYAVSSVYSWLSLEFLKQTETGMLPGRMFSGKTRRTRENRTGREETARLEEEVRCLLKAGLSLIPSGAPGVNDITDVRGSRSNITILCSRNFQGIKLHPPRRMHWQRVELWAVRAEGQASWVKGIQMGPPTAPAIVVDLETSSYVFPVQN